MDHKLYKKGFIILLNLLGNRVVFPMTNIDMKCQQIFILLLFFSEWIWTLRMRPIHPPPFPNYDDQYVLELLNLLFTTKVKIEREGTNYDQFWNRYFYFTPNSQSVQLSLSNRCLYIRPFVIILIKKNYNYQVPIADYFIENSKLSILISVFSCFCSIAFFFPIKK